MLEDMTMKKMMALLGLCGAHLVGCGSADTHPACTPTGFHEVVRPADLSAAPDHELMPPGNQEFYIAGVGSEIGPNCPWTNLYKLTPAQWTTSDPTHVSISSASDTTNGQVTCLGATAPGATVSATLTAYGFTQTLSSPVNCK